MNASTPHLPPVTMTGGSGISLCIVNPNSSTLITESLSHSLVPFTPPGCTLSFVTGPAASPLTIQNAAEMIASTHHTYSHLVTRSPSSDISLYPADAFLVACFSDHPLATILASSGKPAIHLLEASVIHALSLGEKFGIITTGRSMLPDITAGVRKIMGGNSDRFVGSVATELGVEELKSGAREKVESKMKEAAKVLAARGVSVVVLGCAGMTGMEGLVREACAEVGTRVRVVDGAKAGLQVLAGLARMGY
ncbi:Protein DCG1 [Pseudozyma hubeiensis]|nr:Protein DCG1 [Pseudozyma hubeiensis]